MSDTLDTPLRRLEQAFLALADERARLLVEGGSACLDARRGARDDLLRRYAGPLRAEEVEGLLDALDAACERALARAAVESPS